MKKEHVLTGSPWEDTLGYCRAIKIGNTIEVSGTTATKDGKIVGVNDPEMQTKVIFEIVEATLKQMGATLEDVVRTRLFVTDISQWQAYGKVHGELFATIKPAMAIVEVSALIDPQAMIEVEVQAIVK